MAIHKSEVKGTWKGAFNGSGTIRAPGFITSISLPHEFKGLGEGATPEDLFLASVASCYLITFGIILGKAGVRYESLTMSAQLLTETDQPARIKEIVLEPEIKSDDDPATILRLSEKVKDFCVIGKAVATDIKTIIRLKQESRKTNNQMRGVL